MSSMIDWCFLSFTATSCVYSNIRWIYNDLYSVEWCILQERGDTYHYFNCRINLWLKKIVTKYISKITINKYRARYQDIDLLRRNFLLCLSDPSDPFLNLRTFFHFLDIKEDPCSYNTIWHWNYLSVYYLNKATSVICPESRIGLSVI